MPGFCIKLTMVVSIAHKKETYTIILKEMLNTECIDEKNLVIAMTKQEPKDYLLV